MTGSVSRLMQSALESLLRTAAERRRGQRAGVVPEARHHHASHGEDDNEPEVDRHDDRDGQAGGLEDEHDRSDNEWFFEPQASEDAQGAPDTGAYAVDDELFDGPPGRRRPSRRVLAAAVATLGLVVLTVVLVRAAVIRPDAATVQASPASTRAAVPPVPADAPEEGSYSESRVTEEGEVRVQHWVRSSSPMFGLLLVTPPGLGGPGPTKVTDLFVASNQAVLNQPRALGPLGHRLFFDAPPVLVYVRYTIRGAVDRSPSVPGRALARATALDVVRSPQTGPSRVSMVGDGIRSVACGSPTTGVLTPCGTEGKGRWTVLLRGDARKTAVVAQVDLG